MSIAGIIAGVSAIGGLVGGITGSSEAAAAAREQKRLLREQKARNEAWYRRNYYEDYLNSVEAQAALKRVGDAWRERTQEARARQAVTGGTPEQAAAIAEAGGNAFGNTAMGLAAQGAAARREVDAQKAQMDADIAAQQAGIASAEQQGSMQLAQNGMSLVANALSSFEVPQKDKKK